MLNFNDGMRIDTGGLLTVVHFSDGWYVVGKGCLIPVADYDDGRELIALMNDHDRQEQLKEQSELRAG